MQLRKARAAQVVAIRHLVPAQLPELRDLVLERERAARAVHGHSIRRRLRPCAPKVAVQHQRGCGGRCCRALLALLVLPLVHAAVAEDRALAREQHLRRVEQPRRREPRHKGQPVVEDEQALVAPLARPPRHGASQLGNVPAHVEGQPELAAGRAHDAAQGHHDVHAFFFVAARSLFPRGHAKDGRAAERRSFVAAT